MPFDLTPKQKEVRAVFSTAATYFLIYGGARSGKTFFVVYCLIVRALKAPNSWHLVCRSYSVDAKQKIGEQTLPEVLKLAFPGLAVKYNKQEGIAYLPNGSRLIFGGVKDKEQLDKLLGAEYASIYLNEASDVSLAAYRTLETRLAQSRADVDGNELPLRFYVDLNPTVAAHWTYQIFRLGIMPEDGMPVADHSEIYRWMAVNPKDNADNLPAATLRNLQNLPERQRRRFWDGEYTADDDNALWRRGWIRMDEPPQMGRIVVAVDPAVTNNAGSDETGIVAMGEAAGRGYVLEDESGKMRAEEWARRAISLYDMLDADCIVAESNQGGDLVRLNIQAQARGRNIPVKLVTATRGKHIRAEPVAGLYEQGKIRHAAEFTELTDQMCSFTIDMDRKSQGFSPDRVDALVWAATELFPSIAPRKKKVAPVVTMPRSMPMANR